MPNITLTISPEAASRVQAAFDYTLGGERNATSEDVEKWLKRRLKHFVFDIEKRKLQAEAATPAPLEME